jgi:ABC-type Fe3+/spermidine/putrescine transport system ATPase subunit
LEKKTNEYVSKLEISFDSKVKIIEKEIKSIRQSLNELQNKVASNQEQNMKQIETQEEIIMSMIHKFDDQFMQDKSKIEGELEKVKADQDVLKISFTVNEKQLLEKIKAMIYTEIRNACREKEYEILMNTWISELNEIIADFEKLKKLHPQEFNIKMNEIARTIELFKQKITK